MMKRKNYYFLAAALCAMLLGNGCDKKENPELIIDPVDATGIKATTDTVRVAYGKSVDLSGYFSLEPANASGTLIYKVIRQPDYVEGNDEEYTAVEAYSVSGNMLISAEKRVPDTLNAGGDRIRIVREGRLSVALAENSEVDPREVVIIQTGKPAVAPVITLAANENFTYTAGPSGKLLTLQATGLSRTFPASWFNIAPIDFDPNDIKVGIGAGDYITMHANGVPQAGGSGAAHGSGGFVVAYYKDHTLEEVLADATLPQARLYIDVEEYMLTVDGIVISPNVGLTNAASFKKSGAKASSSFVYVKLSDGSTRAFDTSQDGSVLSGEFNHYTKGVAENSDRPGWFSNVNLNNSPADGETLSWTITHKDHFKEEGWTVTVTTTKLPADTVFP
jgi:hypothetical protein